MSTSQRREEFMTAGAELRRRREVADRRKAEDREVELEQQLARAVETRENANRALVRVEVENQRLTRERDELAAALDDAKFAVSLANAENRWLHKVLNQIVLLSWPDMDDNVGATADDLLHRVHHAARKVTE